MNLKLLLISAQDFPTDLLERMRDYGFGTLEARGRLKVKELLEAQSFDALIWCIEGYDQALAQDLLETLNQRPPVPLILLTGNLEAQDFALSVEGSFGRLDLGEEPAELLKAIEFACTQPKPSGATLQEIDFKGLVSQVTGQKANFPPSATLKLQSAWLAVDGNEKRLLSTRSDLHVSFWDKLSHWLQS